MIHPPFLPPLSLYIHLPWCIQKCPYCDFNSHEMKNILPEAAYTQALLQNLDAGLPLVQGRSLTSIFFGGGTPSLFSDKAIATILNEVFKRFTWHSDIEITLEANPGTVDQSRFEGFKQAGVNRLSLGIQSLQNDKLKILGRIHDSDKAKQAILHAKKAGFDNVNLDMMYGLPHQSIEDALSDLTQALSFFPTHFSWYQLTIEPNTVFYRHTPPLPVEDHIWEMQVQGQALLASSGFQQYEVSAYSLPQKECTHNLNYWLFGDYLGVGAGAHSKITQTDGSVIRFAQMKQPKDFLNPAKRAVEIKLIKEKDLIFEFMLNALRLTKGISLDVFETRTGLSSQLIEKKLALAQKRGLLLIEHDHIHASPLGQRFLNDLVEMFL
jgi:putative oxygen-independent coproporphyrinogen III oxidase